MKTYVSDINVRQMGAVDHDDLHRRNHARDTRSGDHLTDAQGAVAIRLRVFSDSFRGPLEIPAWASPSRCCASCSLVGYLLCSRGLRPRSRLLIDDPDWAPSLAEWRRSPGGSPAKPADPTTATVPVAPGSSNFALVPGWAGRSVVEPIRRADAGR